MPRSSILLILGSALLTLLCIEFFYRVFFPFPYYPPHLTEKTEHSLISEYDPVLGWKGIPNATRTIYLQEKTFSVQHNNDGFRDINHPQDPTLKSIIFLGDSFTWGYGVEEKEIFINKLRQTIKNREIYNLAYPGYGTDQALLTFKFYPFPQPFDAVVLMVSENDFTDNILPINNEKTKPYFTLSDKNLILNNIPVPKNDFPKFWNADLAKNDIKEKFKTLILKSHFLHDVTFRMSNLFNRPVKSAPTLNDKQKQIHSYQEALSYALLRALSDEIKDRGAKLFVVAIPSKKQFLRGYDEAPYQKDWEVLCSQLNIPFLDLATAIKPAGLRAYYRVDNHWNHQGHRLAADAIESFLQHHLES